MADLSSKKPIIIGLIFIIIGLIFIVKLFTLQILESKYKLSAENNVLRYSTQYPARGLVFDRNGELLVYNQPQYDLMVIPHQTTMFDTLDLCSILEIDINDFRIELYKAIEYSKYKPSVVSKQISAEKYAELQEKMFKFKGFYIQTRSARIYPKEIAAHILGYVGEVDTGIVNNIPYYKSGDYIGISGIEKAYEEELRGVKGLNIYLVDNFNRIKGNYKNGKYDTASIIGNNITTTLDADIQKYGELLMQNKRGSIVAIEPETGEILALVSSPAYNPNLLTGKQKSKNYLTLLYDSIKPLFNRAIMAYYPPGSTFKTVQALIGLQEGVITTESALPCNGGFNIGTHIVHCHHGGSVGFYHSISGSCNSYYCGVFSRIMHDRDYKSVEAAYTNWREHLHSFGLGVKLNSDLGHELAGVLYPAEYFNNYYGQGKWGPYSIISMAIGQGELGFTPFQMANLAVIIANKGYYIIPHTVKRIENRNKIDNKYLERHYVNIDTSHFAPVIRGMYEVVQNGTAYWIKHPDISICGKTGTVQNPHGEDHSAFIAFAPKDNPKIAIAVYVENGGYGSTWAAPIAALMIEKYLTDTITRPFMEEKMINGNLMNE